MRLKVLVRTTQPDLAPGLERRLSPRDYRVTRVALDVSAIEQIVEHLPDIFVCELSPSESFRDLPVRSARDIQPDLKTIFLSQRSTHEDARIVEQGVFYYAVRPGLDEVVEVVQAAARGILRNRERQIRWVPEQRAKEPERRLMP